jgi:pimeloyl-ACP methyl ester carboxylesterase
LKTYLLASELLIEMPPETFLNKITVPTLVVEGVKDTIFPLEIAIAMQKRIKHSSIEFIEDANHILVLNNPGELSATIDRFLENLR